MDLGCLDMDCISLCDDKRIADPSRVSSVSADFSSGKDGGSSGSKMVTVNSTKNKESKDTPQSSSSALNRFTSQIMKPLQWKTSPLNWFPRKKVDSYLERKIKLLQEAGGMNSSLDETLGDSNPHYCRVEREKIAAREAAHKAMEARKAAMIEASWCRILKAAWIQSKEAEARLLNAEKNVAEALEDATAKGVIMYDTLDCPGKNCVLETSSVKGKAPATHAIRASFETAFDVDKQVAVAVKTALIRFANCPPSSNKDEFKDLMRKISENPDNGENSHHCSEFSSECESDMELDSDLETQDGEVRCRRSTDDMSAAEKEEMRLKTRQSHQKSDVTKLVDMMFERLKCLQEDELASLATIVATCGLNAALAKVENFHPKDHISAGSYGSATSMNLGRPISPHGPGTVAIRNSSMDYFMNGPAIKKQAEPEFPSLDKFLVKHMTKLEKEVEEAKNSMKSGSNEAELVNPESSRVSPETMHDLGSMLIKHSCKLQKEMEKMKKEQRNSLNTCNAKFGKQSQVKEEISEIPSLDQFLVKHVSRLEREVQEAKSRRNREGLVEECQSKTKASSIVAPGKYSISSSSPENGQYEKENYDVNKQASLDEPAADMKGHKNEKTEEGSLDKILLKPLRRLEKEKLQVLGMDKRTAEIKKQQQGEIGAASYESLDKVLVKHVSRLEKEKMNLATREKEVLKRVPEADKSEGGLDQILMKHKSRLERGNLSATQNSEDPPRHSISRREARERELRDVWGGMSLENSIKPGLERDKLWATQTSEDPPRLSVSRREARERELRDVWGGISLENSIKPHVSRLERDKTAWLKAEEEERKAATLKV